MKTLNITLFSYLIQRHSYTSKYQMFTKSGFKNIKIAMDSNYPQTTWIEFYTEFLELNLIKLFLKPQLVQFSSLAQKWVIVPLQSVILFTYFRLSIKLRDECRRRLSLKQNIFEKNHELFAQIVEQLSLNPDSVKFETSKNWDAEIKGLQNMSLWQNLNFFNCSCPALPTVGEFNVFSELNRN